MKKLFSLTVFFSILTALFLYAPNTAHAQCATGQIDLLEYMGPSNGDDFELKFCNANGTGGEPIKVDRGRVNTTDGQKSNGFYINKGSNYEAYFYDSQNIHFYEDTSWDGTCPDGSAAFYRVFTPPRTGRAGGAIPRCIGLNQSFSSNQYINAYAKDGYSRGDTGNICSDSYAPTTVSATIKSAAGNQYAPKIPGTRSDDTIVMTNVSGAGAGEQKFYTKGYGLTGFVAADAQGKIFFHSSFYKDGLSTQEPRLSCDATLTPDGEPLKPFVFPLLDTNNLEELVQGGDWKSITTGMFEGGYSAKCPTEYEIKLETTGAYDRMLELNIVRDGLLSAVKGLESPQETTLWRNSVPGLDMEGTFSKIDTTNLLGSAPLVDLMPIKQRCDQATGLSRHILELCQSLDDPSDCSLNQVLDHGIDTQSLGPKMKDAGLRCSDIAKPWDEGMPANKREFDEIKDAVLKAPIYFPSAFDIAFFVEVTETVPQTEKGGLFSFLFRDQGEGQEVNIVPFLTPYSCGDRPPEHFAPKDPCRLTSELFGSIKDHQRSIALRNERRAELKASVGRNDPSRPIEKCLGDLCEDTLGEAVIELVNANNPGCGTDGFQEVDQIKTSAEVPEEEAYSDGFSLKKFLSGIFGNAASFQSRLKLGSREPSETGTKVKSFIVSRYNGSTKGGSLEALTSSSKKFLTLDQQEKLPPKTQRVPFSGGGASLTSTEAEEHFPDEANCHTEVDENGVEVQVCTNKAGARLNAEGSDSGLEGGHLAYYGWLGQLLLSTGVGHASLLPLENQYEKVIIGGIGTGAGIGSTGSTSQTAGQCTDYENQTVAIPNKDELRASVCQIAQQHRIEPQLLWGVLQIEGGKFLRAIRNGTTSMSCSELINSCGAVGPMQIIQGSCVTDNCNGPIETLRSFNRSGDLCSIKGSLTWAASYLKSQESHARSILPSADQKQIEYMMAGRYLGLNDETLKKPACRGADPVSGCNGLNYCECAADGWDFSCS